VEHEPVLVDEIVRLLVPALEHGGVVVDATLGRGGHAAALLEATPPATVLVGIDRDPDAVEVGKSNLAAFEARIRLVRDDFAHLASVLERLGIEAVRGVLLDLGVSSPQLDEAARGFSFRNDGPLDMRMDPTARLTAEQVVNGYDEDELARIIRSYGEERFAGRIARAISRARPLRSTGRLSEVIADAIPAPARRRAGGHPARRTFQAIRIEVNGELDALRSALPQAVDYMEPGGRIAAVSYHSLEDRIVKQFFADEARGCVCPPDFPVCTCGAEARVRVLTKRPVRPSADEQANNPRSSAAKLRVAERIGAAEMPLPETRRATA
jgi:16S rRNA (cytosine1402-N4)-methyltransferase